MRTIPQRDLRNHSGAILRQAEAGERFTITVDGRPVAMIGPRPKTRWVARDELLRILRALPADPELVDDLATMGGRVADLEDPWPR